MSQLFGTADYLPTLALLVAMIPAAVHRDVLTISLGAFVGVPTGTWLLTSLDPLTPCWAIVALAAVTLAVLASGWRYRNRPTPPMTILVGLISDLCSGAAQVEGPPVVAHWLGGTSPAQTVRANILFYFAITSLI